MACAILHNMDVVERKNNFTGTRETRICVEGDGTLVVDGLPTIHPPADVQGAQAFWEDYAADMEGHAQHMALKAALVDHNWETVAEGDGDEALGI